MAILIEDLMKMMDKEDMEKEMLPMKVSGSNNMFESIPEKGSMRKIKLSDRNPEKEQEPREGRAESDTNKPYIPSYQTNATSNEAKLLVPSSNGDDERPPLFYGVYNIQPQGNKKI